MKKYKLGDIAIVEISGVDKKIKEDEIDVHLCNFTDVYYNWAITKKDYNSFMKATANNKEISRFLLKKGQVALTKDSETRYDIGISSYIAEDFDNVILGYHCALITPDESKVNGKYLNAFMHSQYIRKYFEYSASGSGQRYSLSVLTLENMPVLLPPIEVQRYIGKILTNIDRKIELNRSINHNLEAMAKQLYDYWFLQFDFPDENGKPYKSSGGKMVWNEKLKREIPEGWDVDIIQNIATTYSGGTPKSANKEYYKNGTIAWINSGELNSSIITQALNYITEKGLNNSSAKLYPANTVLVAMYGATTGKVSLLTFEACSNQAVCGVIPNMKEMQHYVYLYLSSLYSHFINLSIGSARDNISQEIIKNMLLPIPSTDVILMFENKVKHVYKVIIEKKKQINTLTKLRESLLPLFMNGQASPQNCD
jgi:putative type I DNA restriction-modification